MKRNLIPLVPVISAFLLAGCFGSKETTTTASTDVSASNTALKSKLSLFKSANPEDRAKAIEAIMNMPVGKTSMSLSVPSKFSNKKKKQ